MNKVQEKLVQETDNVSIFFDEENNIFTHKWTDPHNLMQLNLDIFKGNLNLVLRYQNKLKSEYVIMDMSDIDVTFSVELHKWGGELIRNTILEAETKKFAVIESKDFFTKISIKQLIEEAEAPFFEISFFSNEIEAFNWFLKS